MTSAFNDALITGPVYSDKLDLLHFIAEYQDF